MPNVRDLGRAIKKEYPGEYDDVDDVKLGRAIKAEYPDDYADITDIGPKKKTKAQTSVPRSAVSTALELLERGTNVASSPMTKHVYSRLGEGSALLEGNWNKIEALRSLREDAGNKTLYPSDAAEISFPWLKTDDTSLSEINPISAGIDLAGTGKKFLESGKKMVFKPKETLNLAAKTLARLGIDIAGDPLSALSVELGGLTKAGKLAQTTKAAVQSGQKIKLDSPLAKEIARQAGKPKPTPQLIKDYLKTQVKPGTNITERVKLGQQSLISAKIPGIDKEFNITGKLASKVTEPFTAMKQTELAKRIDQGIREVFSNKTGDPDFDTIASEIKDVIYHRTGVQLQEGLELNKKLEDITRRTGIPREKLNQQISQLTEAINPSSKSLTAQRYGRAVAKVLDEHYSEKLLDAKITLANAYKSFGPPGPTSALASKNSTVLENLRKEVSDYQELLNNHRGVYQNPQGIDPEIEQIVKDLRFKEANQLMKEQNAGVRITPALSDREYLAHIITPEFRDRVIDVLQKKGALPNKLSEKEVSDHLANSIRRQFIEVKPKIIDAWASAGIITKREARSIKGKDGLNKLDKILESGRISELQYTDAVHALGIDEVNELARGGKLEHIIGKEPFKGDVFHTDPVYGSTIRGIRGEEAIGGAQFYQELVRRGIAVPDNPKTAPVNWVNVKASELTGYKVSPEVARVLNKWNEINIYPSELRKILSAYDRFHTWSKAWTLAPFPAYHTVNSVGNFWNNWLAGVTNPDVYRQAINVQSGRGNVIFKDVFGNKWDSKKLAQSAKELGVVDRGWFNVDYNKTIKEEIEWTKHRASDYITLSRRNRILRGGQRVGRAIENNARMAHFIDRLRKGDTAEQAAMSVKKFLFDYGDLTNVERQIFNRTFFFYTWTRKNIPLQLHSLITKPNKFNLPFQIKHEIEKNVEPANERYLAEYAKENFPVRIRYDRENKVHEYFLLNKWLPAADLVKLAHLHEVAAQMLAPLPKELIQQLWNTDFFTKSKIENIPGEQGKFMGKNVPKRVIHVARVIRLLNEIDKMTDEDRDIYSKILTTLTGKTYYFDYQKELMRNTKRVTGELGTLKKEMIQAGQSDNDEEFKRIRDMYLQKAGEY